MKFASTDQTYIAQRKALSQDMGPRELWSVIDQWPLYVGVGNLARFLAISDIVRSTLDVPGDIAEFGSFRGGNLMFMTKVLRILDPHSLKRVHSFDSFQGLTEFTAEDGIATQKAGAYKGNLDELQAMIDLYQMQDDIRLHVGLIEQTLTPLLAAEEALSFSMVYIDTDLYSSTKLILDSLHGRLMKGGVFVFDEWNMAQYPGEGRAANEFLERHGEAYAVEHVRNARQPNLVLRKQR